MIGIAILLFDFFDTCLCNLFFPVFFSSWEIRWFLYSKGWSSSGRKSWRNSRPWNRLSRRWKPRSELSHDLCIFWCFSSQFQFLALCFLGQPFIKTQSIYLCPYHLFVPCPFSCLALPLARYASEHGPHGSTKELSKKEPKTRYDYEVQNRGKIHDLEHEPRGWKSRNLSKSQLSVLGVAGIHSLLGATVCWTPKGGLSSFLAEFLTLPAWTGCQKGFFWSWRISPVKFSNSGVDIEDVTSFKVCKPSSRYLPCHFLSQVGKEGGGVYWIGHCGVLAALGAHENRRFILKDTYLNLFDNLSASISFRCLLLVALHRSLWLFHGSRCSPASPKKWRGHPQWDPQVVEWLIA